MGDTLDEVHKQNSTVYFLSSYFPETVYVGLFSDINININDEFFLVCQIPYQILCI